MGIKSLFKIGSAIASGGGLGIASQVIGTIGKVADKIWLDKNVRDTNMAAIAIATTNAERDGDLAEYEAEKERFKDIRESGWLSRQVRPVIALTFHAFFWGAFFFDPNFKAKVGTVIAEFQGIKITVGMMYFIILCFYFLTKGIKDYFITKKPQG